MKEPTCARCLAHPVPGSKLCEECALPETPRVEAGARALSGDAWEPNPYIPDTAWSRRLQQTHRNHARRDVRLVLAATDPIPAQGVLL